MFFSRSMDISSPDAKKTLLRGVKLKLNIRLQSTCQFPRVSFDMAASTAPLATLILGFDVIYVTMQQHLQSRRFEPIFTSQGRYKPPNSVIQFSMSTNLCQCFSELHPKWFSPCPPWSGKLPTGSPRSTTRPSARRLTHLAITASC